MSRRYRFDGFELDGEAGTLSHQGEPVPLQDLPLRLLVALIESTEAAESTESAEAAPAIVSRETLYESLWPPGTHLDLDASLNTAVARVREALGDDASSPRFVATVPKKGYRFVATVEPVRDRRPGSRWSRRVSVGAVAVALVAVGVWWALSTSRSAARGGAHAAGSPGSAVGAGGLVGHGIRVEASGRERARESLLLALHFSERRSRDGLERAIAAYQSAAAVAPDSAEAYSGLAVSYALLGMYDYWRPREAFGPAEIMARRALELDPESAPAHLAMGVVAAVVHWDWRAATAESLAAVEARPGSAMVWLWRGSLLSALGRHDEAIECTRRALAIDPTSPVVNTALAWHLFLARRDDEAVAQSRHTIDLFPDYYDAWDNLKWIGVTLGHRAEGLEAWIRADQLDEAQDSDGDGAAALRRAYEAKGLEALHRAAIEEKLARWRSGSYQSPYDVVLEYAALGEVDEAIAWLERSFDERETDLTGLAVDPRLDVLRGDRRFQALQARMGFPATP